MDFKQAFEHLVEFEGGFVDDADDTGGATKYGISQKSYPEIDISSLSLDHAAIIYQHDFWDKLQLDQAPPQARLALFDAAVNCGPGTSVKFAQLALGIPADGLMGPATLQRLETAFEQNAQKILALMLSQRFKRVHKLENAPKYIEGWTERMFKVIAYSL